MSAHTFNWQRRSRIAYTEEKVSIVVEVRKWFSPVYRAVRALLTWLKSWRLSLFEKVILVNSVMLIGEALAGLWVTSHSLEAHHYLIDTGFLVLATLLTLFSNVILLRASFRPLFSLLATMRKVSTGETQARAALSSSDSEISELAQAFNSMLDRLEASRREQTKLILQAQEKEQRRIALELHDEAGQNLTALLIHAEVLKQSFQALPPPTIPNATYDQALEELQQLTQLTQLTLENVRVLAQQLRPSVLDDLGLLAAFRWLVEDSRQRLHLEVKLEIDGIAPLVHALPPEYEATLFRIAQESLTNIARHAQAQQAAIVLRRDVDHICLHIQDNGCGYMPTQRQAGLGILGMQERALLLRGNVSIHSQPGQGTTVQAILPLPLQGAIPFTPAGNHIRNYTDGS